MSSRVNFPKCALGIVAHPDDIEFLMAGTLLLLRQAGWEVHYLAVASGNCGSVHDDAATTRRRRRAEAQEAARILGAHWHPSLTDDLEIFYQDSLIRALSAVIREVKPGMVLTHPPDDYMEDHTATSRLAVTAAFIRGMRNAKSVPSRTAANFDTMVYHAMPHGLRDPLRRRIVPSAYVNTTRIHATKRAALSAHRSQQDWLQSSQGMNSYLQTMEDLSFEVGRMSGRFKHAEGWRRHSHLGFASEDADPLREALGKNVLINKTYEKNLERGLLTALP
ncbi:MAG: PIG-L deacetylase family protein [Limisphaerales bacterium]